MQKNVTITPEELLRPRYKVIAIWPGMHIEPFRLNEIVTLQYYTEEEGEDKAEGFVYIPYKHKPKNFMWESFFTLFPHLFKKLEWYEERKTEEMPEYVKWDYNPKTDNEDVKGLVEKVIKWVQDCHGVVTSGSMVIATCHWLPATAAEYEQYINKK